MCKGLVDYCDHTEGTIKFGTGESFTITSYDVGVLMGLTNRGTHIVSNPNITSELGTCSHYYVEYYK